MFPVVLVLVLLNVLYTVSPKLILEDGYHWRDYKHSIPGDAIPGGLDNAGRPIYIGQVLYKNMLIPGKIYSNNSDIYFHWGPVEKRADKNVKILCSWFRDQFQWILTSPSEAMNLNGRNELVDGGYEPNFFTYVGRIFAGGETTVGKVICKVNCCLGLFFSNKGVGLVYDGPFEILAYKNNTIQPDVDPDTLTSGLHLIDVRFAQWT